MTRHTLNGEICRPETDTAVEPKFYMLPEIGYMITSFVFTAALWVSQSRMAENSIFSLSLIMNIKHAQEYLPLHAVCEDRMNFFVKRLQAHLQVQTADSALKDLSPSMLQALENLNNARKAVITEVDIEFTAFGDRFKKFDEAFLAKVITSHLQTCSCTIVIGSNVEDINAIILALALFMPGNDKQRCRLSTDEPDKYNPELLLQGLKMLPHETWQEDEVIQNKLPTTIIDLNKSPYSVSRTCLYNQYKRLRNDYLDSEIVRLNQKNSAAALKPTIGMFKSLKESSPMVRVLVSEILKLRPAYLQEAYANHFQRLLTRKAITLIKYLESENLHPSFDRESLQRNIKLDLNLADNDFLIIVAVAERLKPGIFVDLFGDPHVLEEKITSVFKNF